MWNLLLFAVIAAAPQFQVDAQSASGSEATEIREAVVRALVAGGSRVVLGGNESDCEKCARVRVIEKSGSIFLVEVDQNGRKKASRLKVNPDAQLLDKARAVAVQVRLLVRPMAEESPPSVVSERRRPPPSPKAVPPAAAPVASGVQGAPLPVPAPMSIRAAQSPAPVVAFPPAPVEPAVKAEARPTVVPPPLSSPSPIREPAPVARKVEAPTPVEDEPPPSTVKAKTKVVAAQPRVKDDTTSSTPTWPYVPLTVGAVAGVSAVVCGFLARDRYTMLSDRNLPYAEAVQAKNTGEQLQLAAYILGGTALAAELVALLGFTARPIGITPVAESGSDGTFFGVVGALP